MVAEKIRALLDRKNIPYTTIQHIPAYTANEIAHTAHVSGKVLAKTVIVKADKWMAMVVVPASRRISLEDLQEVVGTKNVRLAHEYEFERLFPDCERGAMPPFGNLYGLDVYLDPSLATHDEIVFNAGTHTDLIRMRFDDFDRLVMPHIASVA